MCDKPKNQTDELTRRSFLREAIAATSLVPGVAYHTHAQARRNSSSVRSPVANAAGTAGKGLPSAAAMAQAAAAFVRTLSAEQQAKLMMKMDEEERHNWHFVPRTRKGISLKELDPAQREGARTLLSAGLSTQGLTKATTIIELENVLREVEKGGGPTRDPELYCFSLFGQPNSQKPWGWRVEGHHISLNYTLVNNDHIASTPAFFGANPAEVRHGARKGLRTLRGEEDGARQLLKSLDDAQRTEAVVSDNAPRDILSGNQRKATPLAPAGIAANKMGDRQKDLLMSLLGVYAANMPTDIARVRMSNLRAGGFNNIFFAWAGGGEQGQAHYYRIQGPSFLVEYDNIQNNANHIHTIWRDFNGDFGADLLAMHYKKDHH